MFGFLLNALKNSVGIPSGGDAAAAGAGGGFKPRGAMATEGMGADSMDTDAGVGSFLKKRLMAGNVAPAQAQTTPDANFSYNPAPVAPVNLNAGDPYNPRNRRQLGVLQDSANGLY